MSIAIWLVVDNITTFEIWQDTFGSLIYIGHISYIRLAGFGISCYPRG